MSYVDWCAVQESAERCLQRLLCSPKEKYTVLKRLEKRTITSLEQPLQPGIYLFDAETSSSSDRASWAQDGPASLHTLADFNLRIERYKKNGLRYRIYSGDIDPRWTLVWVATELRQPLPQIKRDDEKLVAPRLLKEFKSSAVQNHQDLVNKVLLGLSRKESDCIEQDSDRTESICARCDKWARSLLSSASLPSTPESRITPEVLNKAEELFVRLKEKDPNAKLFYIKIVTKAGVELAEEWANAGDATQFITQYWRWNAEVSRPEGRSKPPPIIDPARSRVINEMVESVSSSIAVILRCVDPDHEMAVEVVHQLRNRRSTKPCVYLVSKKEELLQRQQMLRNAGPLNWNVSVVDSRQIAFLNDEVAHDESFASLVARSDMLIATQERFLHELKNDTKVLDKIGVCVCENIHEAAKKSPLNSVLGVCREAKWPGLVLGMTSKAEIPTTIKVKYKFVDHPQKADLKAFPLQDIRVSLDQYEDVVSYLDSLEYGLRSVLKSSVESQETPPLPQQEEPEHYESWAKELHKMVKRGSPSDLLVMSYLEVSRIRRSAVTDTIMRTIDQLFRVARDLVEFSDPEAFEVVEECLVDLCGLPRIYQDSPRMQRLVSVLQELVFDKAQARIIIRVDSRLLAHEIKSQLAGRCGHVIRAEMILGAGSHHDVATQSEVERTEFKATFIKRDEDLNVLICVGLPDPAVLPHCDALLYYDVDTFQAEDQTRAVAETLLRPGCVRAVFVTSEPSERTRFENCRGRS